MSSVVQPGNVDTFTLKLPEDSFIRVKMFQYRVTDDTNIVRQIVINSVGLCRGLVVFCWLFSGPVVFWMPVWLLLLS